MSTSEKAITCSKAPIKSVPAKFVGFIVFCLAPSAPKTLANVAIPNITLNNLKFSLSAPYLPIDNLELWLL